MRQHILMQYCQSKITAFKLTIVVLAGLVMSLLMAPVAHANSIISCNPWQYSAHTKSRECLAQTGAAIQYDDYGPDDGWCVKPQYWLVNGDQVIGWSNVWATNLDNWAPLDCSQGSVTTIYTQLFSQAGNVAAWRAKANGSKLDYNTTCMSNPAKPAYVSGKPYCW